MVYYCNDKWQVLEEYDGGDNFKSLYIYGNYIDEVLYSYDANSSSQYYYVHDHLYSPAALVDTSTGAALERYEYDAYGNVHVLEAEFTADADNQSDYGNAYFFTGRRLDILDNSSLKIQYSRNRYYDYYTGRSRIAEIFFDEMICPSFVQTNDNFVEFKYGRVVECAF